jgi:alkanesulfonate monooxygenase SsuD/methylene tetrahydromethanopterin reductase-like flavin-dependent oxidoreductase (luciferase family)
LPIYLAAVGPRNLRLTGEIADGWVGVFSSPERLAESLAEVRAGRERAGKTMDGFEVLPSVPIGTGDDPESAAAPLRHYYANFIGLGDPERSIYYALAVRLGFADAAARIRQFCQSGDRAAAAAAVPLELIQATALIGDAERIADRMAEYERAGVTTLGLTLLAPSVEGQLATVEVAARALRLHKSRTAPGTEPASIKVRVPEQSMPVPAPH